MSTSPVAHLADVGTSFEVTITNEDGTPIDISAATVKKILLKPPRASSVTEKTASFTTNGSDGKIHYKTVSGDLSESGTWHIQAYVSTPLGSWHSSISTFIVVSNLQ